MNVLATSLSLLLVGIAMIHPVFFMLVNGTVKKGILPRQYLKSNYIVHLIAGLLSVLIYWLYQVNYPLQVAGIVYLFVAVVVVLFYWNTELTKWNLFSASIIFGFIVFYRSINEIVEITPLWPGLLTGLLGAVALSILIYLLLESFYKPINGDRAEFRGKYLKILFIIIGLRIIWQVVVLFNLSVATQYGETISALKFFWQANPIRLSFIVTFGMLIPSGCLAFLRKQSILSSLKSRKLLVLLLFSAIFIAELLDKYFLLQFGIVL